MVESYNRANGGEKEVEPLDAGEMDELTALLDSVPLTMRMH